MKNLKSIPGVALLRGSIIFLLVSSRLLAEALGTAEEDNVLFLNGGRSSVSTSRQGNERILSSSLNQNEDGDDKNTINESQWASDGEGFLCVRDVETVVCEVQFVGRSLEQDNIAWSLYPFWAQYSPFVGHDSGLFFNDVPFTSLSSARSNETNGIVGPGDILVWNWTHPAVYGLYLQVEDAAQKSPPRYYYSDSFLNNPSGTRTFALRTAGNGGGGEGGDTQAAPLAVEFFSPNLPNDILLTLKCQGMLPMQQVENLWERPEYKNTGNSSSLEMDPSYQRIVNTSANFRIDVSLVEDQPLASCAEDKWSLQMWLEEERDSPTTLTDITYTQQIVRACLFMISGILSMLSSGYLVFAIVTRYRKTKFTAVRDRLIGMMSCVDIMNSLCLACGPFLSPSNSNIDMIGARGSEASCRFQGFGIQLGFGVPAYNVMLCIYYISAILGGRDETTIRRKQEWWMQSVPIVYALGTAISGLVLDLYHPNGTFCWIEAYPKNCPWNGWHDCLAGENASTLMIGFAGGPLAAFFVTIVVCMVLLIRALRKTIADNSLRSSSGRRKVGITTQALLYIVSFCLTYTCGIIISLMIVLGKSVGFWAHALNSFFLPLQGFWNAIIFLRPTVQRLRSRNKKLGLFRAWWKAALQESIHFRPPLRPRRRSLHWGRSSLRTGMTTSSSLRMTVLRRGDSIDDDSPMTSRTPVDGESPVSSSVGEDNLAQASSQTIKTSSTTKALATVEEGIDEVGSPIPKKNVPCIELSAEDVEWPIESSTSSSLEAEEIAPDLEGKADEKEDLTVLADARLSSASSL